MKTDRQFEVWASQQGIPSMVIETLVSNAPKREDLLPEVTYHVSHLKDIMSMNGENGIPVPAVSNGFIVIGTCCNGDPVAMDFQEDIGSIHYLSHEQMFGPSEPREYSVQVGKDIYELEEKLDDESDFPLDYWDAKHAG